MQNRVRAEKPDNEGNLLFRIENDDVLAGGGDVRLVPQTVDLSLFGESPLPADSKAYAVETNAPNSTAHVLHVPREKKIVVRTSDGQIKKYSYSGSLSDSILEAYNGGAFRP